MHNYEIITCYNNHTLINTDDLSKTHNYKAYLNNKYICNNCRAKFSCTDAPCFHCATCQFDLCPACSRSYHQTQFSLPTNMNKPEIFSKIVTCENFHALEKLSELSRRRSGWTKGYINDNFICNACGGRFDSCEIESFHCHTCEFDLCPDCYYESSLIRIECPRQHQLYMVSSLERFHKLSSLYKDNQYFCNRCKKKNNASVISCVHCKTCKFDLCKYCSLSLECSRNIEFDGDSFVYAMHGTEKVLVKENNAQKERKEDDPGMICVVCLDSTRSHLFSPCNHLCVCEGCDSEIIKNKSSCPICRQKIIGSVKVFMS